jgi:hypothetical protein
MSAGSERWIAEFGAVELLDLLPDCVLVLDRQATILWANTVAEQVLGRPLAGLSFESLLAEDDILAIVGVDELLQAPMLDLNVVLSMADGTRKALLVSSRPVPGATTVLSARMMGEAQEHLADAARYAAAERERSDELARARDALERANTQLVETHNELMRASRLAGMAQIATESLHTIGNAMNSIGVSASLVQKGLSRVLPPHLDKLADTLEPYLAQLPTEEAGRACKLVSYLRKASHHGLEARETLAAEVARLLQGIEDVHGIVASQQQYATKASMLERFALDDVVTCAFRLHEDALARSGIAVDHGCAASVEILADRQQVIEVVACLIAFGSQVAGARHLRLRSGANDERSAYVEVGHRGGGFAVLDVSHLFSHDVATSGLGLHQAANTIHALGGALRAEPTADGGVRFVVTLPRPAESPSTRPATSTHDLRRAQLEAQPAPSDLAVGRAVSVRQALVGS